LQNATGSGNSRAGSLAWHQAPDSSRLRPRKITSRAPGSRLLLFRKSPFCGISQHFANRTVTLCLFLAGPGRRLLCSRMPLLVPRESDFVFCLLQAPCQGHCTTRNDWFRGLEKELAGDRKKGAGLGRGRLPASGLRQRVAFRPARESPQWAASSLRATSRAEPRNWW